MQDEFDCFLCILLQLVLESNTAHQNEVFFKRVFVLDQGGSFVDDLLQPLVFFLPVVPLRLRDLFIGEDENPESFLGENFDLFLNGGQVRGVLHVQIIDHDVIRALRENQDILSSREVLVVLRVASLLDFDDD